MGCTPSVCSIGAAACYLLLMLTRAVLMRPLVLEGQFKSEHAGCGNYATENVIAAANVSSEMALLNCSERAGDHCDNYLNRSTFGCIDGTGGGVVAAMKFSDVAPVLPVCQDLGGEWNTAGHCDNLHASGTSMHHPGVGGGGGNCSAIVRVVQNSTVTLSWRGESALQGAFQGHGTVRGVTIVATLNATYQRSKGPQVTEYELVGAVDDACGTIIWQRGHQGWFETWTRRALPTGSSSPGMGVAVSAVGGGGIGGGGGAGVAVAGGGDGTDDSSRDGNPNRGGSVADASLSAENNNTILLLRRQLKSLGVVPVA